MALEKKNVSEQLDLNNLNCSDVFEKISEDVVNNLNFDIGQVDDLLKSLAGNSELISAMPDNIRGLFTNSSADFLGFLENSISSSDFNIDNDDELAQVKTKLKDKVKNNKDFPVTGLQLLYHGALDDNQRQSIIEDVLENGTYDMRLSKNIEGIKGIDYPNVAKTIVEEIHNLPGSKGTFLDDEKIIGEKLKKLYEVLGNKNPELADYLVRSNLCGETIWQILSITSIALASVFGLRILSKIIPRTLAGRAIINGANFSRRSKFISIIKYILIIASLYATYRYIEIYRDENKFIETQRSIVDNKKSEKSEIGYTESQDSIELLSVSKIVENVNPMLPIRINKLRYAGENSYYSFNYKSGLELTLDELDLDQEKLLAMIWRLYKEKGLVDKAKKIFCGRVLYEISNRNLETDTLHYVESEENKDIYDKYNNVSDGLFGKDLTSFLEDVDWTMVNEISNQYMSEIVDVDSKVFFADETEYWYKDLLRLSFLIKKTEYKNVVSSVGKFIFVENIKDCSSLPAFDLDSDVPLEIGRNYSKKVFNMKIFSRIIMKNYYNVDDASKKIGARDLISIYDYLYDNSILDKVSQNGIKYLPKKIDVNGNNYYLK